MTDDEIISTWQRVCEFPDASGRLLTITREDALEVARALLAAEREACAQVCDELASKPWDAYKHATDPATMYNPHVEGLSDGAEQCAAAIRSLA